MSKKLKQAKLGSVKVEKLVKVLVSDPEKADRKLELSDSVVELKVGLESQVVELTLAQVKELAKKFSYLKVELVK